MKKKVKRIAVAVLLAALMLCALTFVLKGINETIVISAGSLIREKAVRIINDAVSEALTDETRELLKCEKDEKGNITLMSVDTAAVNAIIAESVEQINEQMALLGYEGITVPAGNLFASPYTVGLGPQVSIKAMLSGGVIYELKTMTAEAGINQTSFSMYISFTAPMTYYSGFLHEDMDVNVTVPVYEVIIVGDVPETYAKLNDAADFANLIP